MLSVIIPSRNTADWPFLQMTVDDLFVKAEQEIEVIVIHDGHSPYPPLKPRPNLIPVYNDAVKGMRYGINLGARLAKGKWIMKVDDHCCFGQGYDRILKENCDENWLAVPSRYALNAQKWMDSDPRPFKYGPIEYLYLTYPFHLDNQFGFGFHGKKWCGAYGQGDGYYWKEKNMKGVMLDNIISFQGSCWFMGRENFYRVGGMQYEGYYEHQEAQEIGFKVWTSGGRCIVNKKTWYAHLHKGPEFGRGYHMLKHHQMESNIYATKVWMNHPGMRAVVDRFWPLDYWPEDWDDHRRWENYDFGWWHKSHEIREKVKEVTGIDGKIHPIPYEVIKGVYDTVMEGILE